MIATLLLLLAAPSLEGEVRLQVATPPDGAYVSGPTTIRADLEPASAALRVTFGVDGRVLCTVERAPFECSWDAGPGVAVHHVRIVATLQDGRRLVANSRTKGSAFAPRADADVVEVPTTVLDANGKPVRGLNLDSFRVYEDGVAQPLAHFIGPDAPSDLVVAVDTSASMGDAMPTCRTAVKAFLQSLRPDDKLTLLAFNDNIFTLARRETDPATRLAAVERLTPWGGTALYDVTLQGLRLLVQLGGRHAFVAFTDGEDTASLSTAADVEREVLVADVPIYLIAQGRGVREHDLKRVMQKLSDVSGGRAFFTERIQDLGGVFAEIAQDLASQYVLGYEPLKAARDGSWRSIRVEVVGAPHRVRARQGYRAVPLK